MTRANKITTLFFDFGEVVITNDWTYVCPQKDKEFYSYYKIKNFSYFKNPYFEKLVTGKISENEFWLKALKYFKAKNTDPKKAIQLAYKYHGVKPKMIKLLLRLTKNKYRLAAITTTHKELLDWKIKKFNLDKYFEIIISSCYSGINKPNPKIYKLALKKMNVKPEESVFIDDSLNNIKGAEKIGMKGIHFKEYNKFIKQLHSLGISL